MTTTPHTPRRVEQPGIIVCYARCWACRFGQCHPEPTPHPWWDAEDLEHAAATGQEPPTGNCACPCAQPAPRRVQRKRTAGWTLAASTANPLGAVIVDRTSRYGNPFTIAAAHELGYVDPRQAAVAAFDEWLSGNRNWWQSDEGDRRRERILANLHRLRGRDVACTCKPDQQCHGDTLIRRANADDVGQWIDRVRTRVARNRKARGEDPLPAVASSGSPVGARENGAK